MSGYFYIQDDEDNFYELTLTSSITINYPTSSTDHPVEDGFNVSDNVVNGNVTINYEGLLSNIINYSLRDPQSHGTVQQNIERLLSLRDSRKPFTVNYDSRETQKDSLMPALNNCVFTDLRFSRASGEGDSYKVKIGVKQLIISKQAELITMIEPAPSVKNQAESLKESSSNNTSRTTIRRTGALSGTISLFEDITGTTKLPSELTQVNIPNSANSKQVVSLSDQPFTIKTAFNSRNNSWYLSIKDSADENSIVDGLRVMPNQDLLKNYKLDNFPNGNLVVAKVKDTSLPIGRDNFGRDKDYGLFWISGDLSEDVTDVITT